MHSYPSPFRFTIRRRNISDDCQPLHVGGRSQEKRGWRPGKRGRAQIDTLPYTNRGSARFSDTLKGLNKGDASPAQASSNTRPETGNALRYTVGREIMSSFLLPGVALFLFTASPWPRSCPLAPSSSSTHPSPSSSSLSIHPPCRSW